MRRLYIKPTVKTIHLESIELLAGSPGQVYRIGAAPDRDGSDDTPTWGGNGTGNNFK